MLVPDSPDQELGGGGPTGLPSAQLIFTTEGNDVNAIREVLHPTTVTTKPLHTGAGARRYHLLSLRDQTEVTAALEVLSTLTSPTLADKRVLELACGSGRLTLPLVAAGHSVLATDVDTEALAMLAEYLAPPAGTSPVHDEPGGVGDNPAPRARMSPGVELRQAEMTSFFFDEVFKAVCLSTTSITLLSPERRIQALERAVDHLAPGGALVVSTEYALNSAPPTMSLALGPGITLTEQIGPVADRRRVTLTWGQELYASDLHLVPPTWVSEVCSQLGLTVTYQRSKPDPILTGRVNAVIAAIKHR